MDSPIPLAVGRQRNVVVPYYNSLVTINLINAHGFCQVRTRPRWGAVLLAVASVIFRIVYCTCMEH